jgi:hypothetical protein
MSQALVNSDASSLSRAEGNVPPSTGDGRDDDPEFLAEFRDLLTGLLTDSLPDLGTFGRVIPWLDARQQSQPPFHPARSGIPKRTETRKCNTGAGQADPHGSSEGTLGFCPNNGVHLSPRPVRCAGSVRLMPTTYLVRQLPA